MARPGVEVSLVNTAPSRGLPTETGPAFFVGSATSGDQVAPVKVQSMDQFIAAFGVPLAGSALSVAVETFFREGGTTLYVSRVHHLGSNTGIVTADWQAALDRIDRMLGPGQVAAPGNSTAAVQQAVIAHALDRNRVALIDGANITVQATVLAAAAALNGETGAKFAAFFGNWLTYLDSAGLEVAVPGSAVAAALMAKNDQRNSPNVPAAGDNGVVTGAVGIEAEFLGSEAQALNDGGVNLFRNVYGTTKLYGYRSLSLLSSNQDWWQFNHARLYIGIVAKCNEVAEAYVFDEVDGQRRRLAAFEGDLVGELLPLYNAGSLYGTTPDEAFIVDAVSLQANPDAQLAQGIIRALIGVRMSPFAELVRIQITKVPITEALAA